MERLTVKWKDGVYDTLDPIDIADNEYSKINYEKLLTKLGQYEDVEEQGLLLRLPCKVGTPVYMVAQDCDGDTLDCRRGDCEGCNYLHSFVEENKFDTYMCDDIGKTVFLTKAEAEQALAKMKEGKMHD